MKIIFLGTPEFAVPCLDILVKEGYDILAVITQPDKPKGRGNKLCFCPVKVYANNKNIKVFQPEKIKCADSIATLKSFDVDLFVTVAYGQMLSKEILDIPKFGCINVHASLLPKYRGAAPINWSIINGEKVTGVTTMFTDIGMDTGDMLLKKEIPITFDMTAGDLHDKLSIMGAELIKETLNQLTNGRLERIPQNNKDALYAPMLKKEDGEIDWGKSALEIHNLVRGVNPWPGAYTYYKDSKMKIWRTMVIDENDKGKKKGAICKVGKDGIDVASAKGILRILEVQFDCSRKMAVEEYICGHKLDEGEMLG